MNCRFMPILLAITFFSLSSWAGLEIQRCTNDDNNNAIRICIDLTRQVGKLYWNSETIALQFSGETKLVSEFVLPSIGQTGTVEVFGEEATIQMADADLTHLVCEAPHPGYCK